MPVLSQLAHCCVSRFDSQGLARLLPGSAAPAPVASEEVEEIAITELDVDAARERQRLMRAEDSDDESGGRGQRVQCAQQ